MNDSRAVAVVGATGFLGRPVVERLVAEGMPVRALTRNAEKARPVLPAGCEVAEVDFDSRDDLRRALDGCRAVHLNLSPPDREDEPNPEVAVSLLMAAAKPFSGDLRYLGDLLAYTYRWTLGFRAADTWRDLGEPVLTVEDVARGSDPATAPEGEDR